MMTTTTATTVVRDVCVSFFLPTDQRHWIPNGVATIDLTILGYIWITGQRFGLEVVSFSSLNDPMLLSEEWLDCNQSEWFQLLEEEAEEWCERTHGKGSFWR